MALQSDKGGNFIMGEVQKLKEKKSLPTEVGAVGKDMVYMLSASYVL